MGKIHVQKNSDLPGGTEMSGPTDIAAFLQTDIGKMFVGIAQDYVIPYGKEKLFAAMEPVEISEEEIKQKA